jgi:hypothetical protein
MTNVTRPIPASLDVRLAHISNGAKTSDATSAPTSDPTDSPDAEDASISATVATAAFAAASSVQAPSARYPVVTNCG